MKSKPRLHYKLIVWCTLVLACCGTSNSEKDNGSEIEKWQLGWRMIGSSWEKNYNLGEQQFDSLLRMNPPIEAKFIVTGFEILSKLGKGDKVSAVLNNLDQRTLDELCKSGLFSSELSAEPMCKSAVKEEQVDNKDLQIELIKMHLNDQSVRGNIMRDIIIKYKLDQYELTKDLAVSVDQKNRDRLKEIIRDFGFPTRQMVGKDAMQGVFLIIQHSDGDKDWQKEQLPRIEEAVRKGDMDGQSYAYLYDRIKINGGEKQLYGTQFKNVDPVNKTLVLAETEDIENLDKRRMEVGMMPIKIYEQLMLRNHPK